MSSQDNTISPLADSNDRAPNIDSSGFTLSHSPDNLVLTVTWNRNEVEEKLGWCIKDEDWQAAQELFDITSGGRTADRVRHALECLRDELMRFFDDCNELDFQEWKDQVNQKL